MFVKVTCSNPDLRESVIERPDRIILRVDYKLASFVDESPLAIRTADTHPGQPLTEILYLGELGRNDGRTTFINESPLRIVLLFVVLATTAYAHGGEAL